MYIRPRASKIEQKPKSVEAEAKANSRITVALTTLRTANNITYINKRLRLRLRLNLNMKKSKRKSEPTWI